MRMVKNQINKMKKFIPLITLIGFIACSPDILNSSETKNDGIISQWINHSSLNDEARRIVEDVADRDRGFSIMANPNWGRLDAENPSIHLTGKTPAVSAISINDVSYAPFGTEHMWYENQSSLINFYGQDVHLKFTTLNGTLEFDRYIPEVLQVTQLSESQSLEISRTNQELQWTPDPDFEAGKIAIYYTLYDSHDESQAAGYKVDVILTEDDGSFMLDDLIKDSRCKRIYFKAVRGNTVSFELNEEKYLFHISTYDHHMYHIVD